MALCLVFGLLLCGRGMLPPPTSPICAPQKPAGRKWGRVHLNMNLCFHDYFISPSPKFRALRHLGEGREGGQSFPARQPLKHLQVVTGKDALFDAPSEAI
jgi:hypothetical protein